MNAYDKYKAHLAKVADIGNSIAVLQWDQEVYMPKNGAARRSQQVATLSEIVHKEFTSPEFGELLDILNLEDLDLIQRRNVEHTIEEFKKSSKLPSSLVKDLSLAVSSAFNKWQEAREKNDFQVYAESLDHLIQLRKEESKLLSNDKNLYNAQLDKYEKGITSKDLDVIFSNVKNQLVPLVETILKSEQVNDSFFYKNFPKDQQWDFGMEVLEMMGYDFNSGRQDVSTHPFTTNFSSQDVRVTTRIDENNLAEMLWSTIHEGGHALYELGLPDDQYGLPSGSYLSLGIHESQSRLWENNVCRSKNYWKAVYPKAKEHFPQQLEGVTDFEFYQGMNKIIPSPVRTNADELTYHLHVLIRFEIEQSIFKGEVETKDLRELWNSKYKDYLGLDISSDNDGILQDIHWSHGSFGYFPTYSIGSFYAAQFFKSAQNQITGLDQQIENGNTTELLRWLRENVHIHGKTYTAKELCTRISGEELNFDYFLAYAKEKYSEIYGINL